jgi:hypothetical protein
LTKPGSDSRTASSSSTTDTRDTAIFLDLLIGAEHNGRARRNPDSEFCANTVW